MGKNQKVERIAIKTKILQTSRMDRIPLVEAIYQINQEFHQLSIPARIKKIRRIKFIQFLIIIKVKSS
jgi:hypothetical protein